MASIIRNKAKHHTSRFLSSYLRNATPTSSLSSQLPHHHPHTVGYQCFRSLSSQLPHHHPHTVGYQCFRNRSLLLCRGLLAGSVTNEKPASDDKSKYQGKEEHEQQTYAGWKSALRSPVSWASFALLALIGAGMMVYYRASEAPSAGKAAIGGPFHLTNHQGKPVSEKDFLGQWTLLYFGFTRCPDICPEQLQKLAAAVDKIKEKGGIEIVPVFISVDPERDTVEQVAEYVKEFHPKLIGLIGSSDEIKSVARSYRVYYKKIAEEDSDYLVYHSIVIYLMGPNMEFVMFYGKNNDVDSLADGVIKEIKQHKK